MDIAAYGTTYCGPCKSRNVSKQPIIWCPNCAEGLCESCADFHRVSKSSSQHKTTNIQTFINLPQFVRDVNQKCLLHGDKLELYCHMHRSPCCVMCISVEHNQCPGITALNKMINGVKESGCCDNVRKNIEDLESSLEIIKQNREETVLRLTEQKTIFAEKIKTKREGINKHLDMLEEKLMQQIDFEIKTYTQGIKNSTDQVQSLLLKSNEAKMNLSTIIEKATEFQLYWGIRYLQQETALAEEKLTSLLENDCMQEFNSRLVFTNEIENLESTIKSMGTFAISKYPHNFNDIRPKSQIARVHGNGSSCSETIILKHSKTLKLKVTNDEDAINICSCVMLTDGRVVLADNSVGQKTGKLFLFNKEGTYHKTIPCSSTPFGMTLIGNNRLAVSFFNETCIRSLDVESLKFGDDLFEGYQHFGLSSSNTYLVSAAWDDGIVFMNFDGNILKIFPNNEDKFQYIHLHNEKLFCSTYNNNNIYAINQNGEKIWEYKCKEMIRPKNICTDKYGNLFIAAYGSNNIIVISPSESECKVLLTSSDGICQPKAVFFNLHHDLLVVSNKNGTTFTYKVIYN